MKRGYVTGSFDLLHRGHFNLLEKCKHNCNFLIVGLVSDDLGKKQKRKPILSFELRKESLLSMKWVNEVIKFDGETKHEDFLKIKFDILFSYEIKFY